MNIEEIFSRIEKSAIEQVDLRFVDPLGFWQHFTIPVKQFSKSVFGEGIGIDGSSFREWNSIYESDLTIIPDSQTAFLDPFSNLPTLVLICNVVNPISKERYNLYPRNIALMAEQFLKTTAFADEVYFGCNLEFFIFDDVRFGQETNRGFYYLDSEEGQWNSGKDENPNLAYKVRYKEGYFSVPPTDSLYNLRSEIVRILSEVGLIVEAHHHEAASGGQCEIDIKYDTLVKTADNIMKFKYIVKNTAKRFGKTATFMPKPLFGDKGSKMYTHQSLWKNKEPIFPGSLYGGLSEIAMNYIGGLLKHSKALSALIAPTTNSYKRLFNKYEAPVSLAYSRKNRSASIRIPMYSESPKAKRIEFRLPDPSCNPYIAFAAQLMAGIDGIINRIDPGEPMDKDLYELSPEELKNIPTIPSSLKEALTELEKDNEFLLRGGVFTEDFLSAWIAYKRCKEVEEIEIRPHPYEFVLYYDI